MGTQQVTLKGKPLTVRTSYWRKPIPMDDYDWEAVTDNYEDGHPIGFGRTEAKAIADLLEQLDDEDE